MSGFNEWYEREEEDEPAEIRTPGPPPNNIVRPASLSGWHRSRGGFGYFSLGEEQPQATAPEPAPAPEPSPTPSEPGPTPTEPGPAPAEQQSPTDQKPSAPEPSREEADLRLIRESLSRGIRNSKRLTDIVFFARHPDRKGNPSWASDTALFNEWRQIRDELVLPEFRRSIRARPRPRVIYRPRPTRRGRLHGYPGFGLGYFGAPPVCGAARRDLTAITDDLRLVNNELAKGPGASAAKLTLKRQLLDLDVDGMIRSLDSYIASGCCEPSLKTLESEINALSWPMLVVPTKARLVSGILAAQDRARKDLKHC
jgi:hypothetical protein